MAANRIANFFDDRPDDDSNRERLSDVRIAATRYMRALARLGRRRARRVQIVGERSEEGYDYGIPFAAYDPVFDAETQLIAALHDLKDSPEFPGIADVNGNPFSHKAAVVDGILYAISVEPNGDQNESLVVLDLREVVRS